MRMQRGIRAAAILFTLAVTAACSSVYAQGRGYPNPSYPNQRGGVYRGGYQNPAYNRGLDDGYRQGFDAARDGDRYDVRRESQPIAATTAATAPARIGSASTAAVSPRATTRAIATAVIATTGAGKRPRLIW
jgi:hypothetical protein